MQRLGEYATQMAGDVGPLSLDQRLLIVYSILVPDKMWLRVPLCDSEPWAQVAFAESNGIRNTVRILFPQRTPNSDPTPLISIPFIAISMLDVPPAIPVLCRTRF